MISMTGNLAAHHRLCQGVRKCRQPLDPPGADEIVRLAGRATHGDGRANRGHSAFRRYLMTVWHQKADAMTAATGAEQRADLKFFTMIDDAIAERLGNALDGLVSISPCPPFSLDLERRRV